MQEICNCKRKCKCNSGYECCNQTSNNSLGICCKSGQCDKKNGICKDIEENKFSDVVLAEFGGSQESFEFSNRDGRFLILFLGVVAGSAFLYFLTPYFKKFVEELFKSVSEGEKAPPAEGEKK